MKLLSFRKYTAAALSAVFGVFVMTAAGLCAGAPPLTDAEGRPPAWGPNPGAHWAAPRPDGDPSMFSEGGAEGVVACRLR